MIKIIFFILGTIIGAGLISGKEVQIYFEETGIIGIIVSSLIMSIIIYISMKKRIKEQNKNVKEKNKKIKIEEILSKTIIIILVLSFFVMISGMASLIEQEFKINKIISTIIFDVICNISIKKDIKTILKINEILVIIIIICIILGITLNIPNEIKLINYEKINVSDIRISIQKMFKPMIYASYNLILILEIIEKTDFKKYCINKTKNIYMSIILFVSIAFLLIATQTLIYIIPIENLKENIPLIYVYKENKYIYGLYIITIISAIYTSAISILNSILNEVSPREINLKKRNLISNIICILSIITIFYDFTFGVKNIYVIFGIIGIVKINKILIYK